MKIKVLFIRHLTDHFPSLTTLNEKSLKMVEYFLPVQYDHQDKIPTLWSSSSREWDTFSFITLSTPLSLSFLHSVSSSLSCLSFFFPPSSSFFRYILCLFITYLFIFSVISQDLFLFFLSFFLSFWLSVSPSHNFSSLCYSFFLSFLFSYLTPIL